MRTVNRLTLLGFAGKDARKVGDAVRVSVGTDRVVPDQQQGERREITDWVEVSIFGRQGEWALGAIKKGDLVYAECRVSNGSYEKNGDTVYVTNVVADVITRHASNSEPSRD